MIWDCSSLVKKKKKRERKRKRKIKDIFTFQVLSVTFPPTNTYFGGALNTHTHTHTHTHIYIYIYVCVCVCVLNTSSRVKVNFSVEFNKFELRVFLLQGHTKVKEPSLSFNLHRTGKCIDGFIPYPKALQKWK